MRFLSQPWLILATILPLFVTAAPEYPVPPVNDQVLLELMPGTSYPLPERLFPATADIEAQAETFGKLIRGNAARAGTEASSASFWRRTRRTSRDRRLRAAPWNARFERLWSGRRPGRRW